MPKYEDDTTQEIMDGGHDATLDELQAAITNRRKVIARRLFDDLQEGDTVKIINASKKYLIGATGEIAEKRVSKVTVRFPDDMPHEHDPYGKFAGKRWILPVEWLQLVEEEAVA